MNALKLIALGTIVSFAVSVPAQGQTEPSQLPEQDLSEQTQTGTSQLPQELSEPLEVNQQQADDFFTPPQNQQSVENQAIPGLSSDELIGPPPGSQTPAELTPNRQLGVEIQ